MDPSLPPLDGSLPTLPDLADYLAAQSPDKPWFVFPDKDDSQKIATITRAEVVQASHRVAHIVRPGREGPERKVVALILHTDTVLYVAMLMGLLRAGFVPYPMSPRNTAKAVAHMLAATSCTHIIGDAISSPLIAQVQTEMAKTQLRVDTLPALENVFPELCGKTNEEVKPYPAAATPPALESPSMYIHSSGSTGFPKSISFTHQRMLHWLALNSFGKARLRIAAMATPTFHAIGMLLQLTYPLSSGNDIAVFTPRSPAPPVVPHPQNVYEVAQATGCNAVMALPSFIEAWSHSDTIVSYLASLKVLLFGGGPLAPATGDRLVALGVPLASAYGGTEFGHPTLLWDRRPHASGRADADWCWFRFVENVRFEPQGDGTFELVVLETDSYHLAVHNVPGEKAFATADLFEPHPTKEGLWKIVGRKDDVLMLSTGEKVVPIPQEQIISSNKLISGCVMFGREREQPGVLVELHTPIDTDDPSALARMRNKIWPIVEKANAAAPAFARIFKEMIIFVDNDRPLPRAAKGTILRKMTLQMYAQEIDNLYETVAQSVGVKDVVPPVAWERKEVEKWLLKQATSLVERGKAISVDADLFQRGFDSLSATFLRNRIIGVLRAAPDPALQRAAHNISANIVFEHPTIAQLAVAVCAALSNTSPEDTLTSRIAEINSLIEKYSADLPSPKAKAAEQRGKSAVLLTGATGNIGSHILAALLADERVGRVYALNRPSEDPVGRLKGAFVERGLDVGLLEGERVVVLTGDINQDKFGLGEGAYGELLGSVTHIIHNAWTVNFNLALQSFEPQIAGARRLLNFAASAAHPARLLFTSSIGVANDWNAKDGPVPERPLGDPATAAGAGYGASKYVVEQILRAARARGVAATSVRMGQACGPAGTGAWGTSEWMPALVKSSVALGCLPALQGPVNWMPLDAIGCAYVDWIVSPDALPGLVNVVHPRPTTWDVILKGLRAELGDAVTLVPFQDWMKKLEERAVNPTAQDLADIPALKLLDFFRGLAQAGSGGPMSLSFDTAELVRSSAAMQELRPMTEEHARAWVRFWKAKKFIE